MSVPQSLRSRLNAGYALGAILLGVASLTVLRIFAPGETPIFEILLFGWLGVALGRLTVGAGTHDGPHAGEARKDREAARKHEEKFDRVLQQVVKVLQTHLIDSETFSEHLDGASRRLSKQHSAGPINEIVMALIDDNREMRNKLSSVRDQLEESRLQVVQLQSTLERAEESGLRDVVTAIGNRRYFDACFVEEVEKARRTGDNFCLALTDIDKFKLVNDRFGHLVGDRLLRLFANILVQNVRGQDKVARFGGEEFALMFPGARLIDAESALERIRRILESKQWTVEPSGERVGKVTASFGVALLEPNESPNDLLQRVDQRLYEAKIRGRNRVVGGGSDDEFFSPSRPARTGRAGAP